jgi:hypothetical protein
MDILGHRLANHHLLKEKFTRPEAVIAHLGAVQAQDFAAAKWAVRMRATNATDAAVEEAFNQGTFLRTHVLRPTWHFVMPEDIRWMLELTAPRVKAFMAHYNRKLELTDKVFKTTNAALVKALTDQKYMTRQELKAVITQLGITTDVQRLAHIVMWAELEGLICSGPRRGKQFTYALMDERVPKTKTVSKEESLAKLAERYFRSHGPAQLQDFTWWSGLTVKDSQAALDFIASKLNSETVEGKVYWFSPNSQPVHGKSSKAFLLSIYDEYTIAYHDRSVLVQKPGDFERLIAMGNALTGVIVIDGKVAGTWKRVLKKKNVEFILKPFTTLSANQELALSEATAEYSRFVLND